MLHVVSEVEILLDSFASISGTENDSDVILFFYETERCSIYNLQLQINNNVFNYVTLFTVAGWIASVETALFLPPGSILTPIVFKHSEMPYTVFLRAVSSQGRRGHKHSHVRVLGFFLVPRFLLPHPSMFLHWLMHAMGVEERFPRAACICN